MPPINDHPIVPDHCRASAHAENNKLFMLPELLSRGHIQLETDESFLLLISSDLQMSLERLGLGRAATVWGVELQTKDRKDFTITIFWLKAPTTYKCFYI